MRYWNKMHCWLQRWRKGRSPWKRRMPFQKLEKGGNWKRNRRLHACLQEGVRPCQHLDLSPVICRRLASRTIRESICAAWSHKTWSTLFQQPQKINTALPCKFSFLNIFNCAAIREKMSKKEKKNLLKEMIRGKIRFGTFHCKQCQWKTDSNNDAKFLLLSRPSFIIINAWEWEGCCYPDRFFYILHPNIMNILPSRKWPLAPSLHR